MQYEFDHENFILTKGSSGKEYTLDDEYSSESYTLGSGSRYTFKLEWKYETPPDYDSLKWSGQPTSWDDLEFRYKDASSSWKSIFAKVELQQVWEEILYLSNPSVDSKISTATEGEQSMTAFFRDIDDETKTYAIVVTEDDNLTLDLPIEVESPDGEYYQVFYNLDGYDEDAEGELPFNVIFQVIPPEAVNLGFPVLLLHIILLMKAILCPSHGRVKRVVR